MTHMFAFLKKYTIFPQAARRLSGRMSHRALSLYHFYNEKEELKAAKIAGVVLVIAVVCWTPFIVVIAALAVQG